jgi:hypothetical protein
MGALIGAARSGKQDQDTETQRTTAGPIPRTHGALLSE